jgi:hypothetical protein
MKRSLLLLPVLFIATFVAAGIWRSHARPTGIGIEPEIVSFSATPAVAKQGEPVTLAWNVRGTPSVTVQRARKDRPDATEPEQTNLPGRGQLTVHPESDTVYTLTCQTADGPMCSTSVTVRTE